MIISLWLSLLFLPFKGMKAALIFFVVFTGILFLARYLSLFKNSFTVQLQKASGSIRQITAAFPVPPTLAGTLVLIGLAAVPLFAKD